MHSNSTSRYPLVTRWQSNLLLAASAMTCLLVTMGGIVCVTESAAGCPDWPGCFGQVVPPPQVNAIIEYLHRLIAALTAPLIIAAAVVSWRRTRAIRWLSRPPVVAIGFTAAVVVFGAFAVLTGLPRGIAAIDLGSALVVLALMVTATIIAFARRADPDLPDRLAGSSALARQSLAAMAGTFVVYVSGILVAGKGSLTRCLGWPLARLIPSDLAGWPQLARLAVAVVTALLIVAVVFQAWRTGQRGLRRLAAAVIILFVAEAAFAIIMTMSGSSIATLVIFVALAAALWAMLVALTVRAGLDAVAAEEIDRRMPSTERGSTGILTT